MSTGDTLVLEDEGVKVVHTRPLPPPFFFIIITFHASLLCAPHVDPQSAFNSRVTLLSSCVLFNPFVGDHVAGEFCDQS